MQERSIRETIAFGFTIALAALLCAGAAWAVAHEEGESRNFDARETYNKGFMVQKSASQSLALSALEREVRDLAVTFDATTGVTRTLSSHNGYLTEGTGPSVSAMDAAMAYVTANLAALGISADDLAGYEVTDSVYSAVSGATHIYLRQTHLGLPVYNGQLHINVNRDGRIMSVNNAFVPNLASAVNSHQPSLAANQAVASAAMHLGVQMAALPATLKAAVGDRQQTLVSGDGLSLEAVSAELMWMPVRAGEVRLVWNFQVQSLDYQHWFDMTVDAESGEIWTRFDWTNSGTYRVYQEPDESPNHGSQGRTLVVNPEDPVSQNGWFSGGTMDGNNVHACPDIVSNNVCDSNPQCSGTTCDFPINLSQAPSNFVPAATANLFYWNNLIHDIQYQYGFDEPGGNFQENNFGLGGAGSDSVNADAQDGGGNCNANFATPTDGGNPRMQMYTCTNASPARDGDLDNGVIVHEYGHGISIRQVGGPGNSSCLNNSQQAGEGWSDWWGLVYTHEPGDAGTDSRGIGTYLFGQAANGPGIRDLPYSTNPAVNNWTYESIQGASIPHGVGSRWAQAIWEVYWALTDQYGFEADLHNFNISDPNEAGNKRAKFYVNEGLKNTACSPTFVNNRDGIIQAATDNFGGADVCLIWETFAAFGLGVDAISGGSGSTNPTNGFAIPQSCSEPPPPCTNEISAQDFTSGAQGWTASGASTCTTGTFIVGTPDATAWQPGGGNPGQAFFTQNNPGGIGTDDVDGGTCEALSPVVSASGDLTIIFDYFHGQRDAGDDAGDGFTIEVLNNGSVVDTPVNIGDVTNGALWTTAWTTISNAGNVQLRVRATDAPAGGDIVEAGIDNVQFCGTGGGGGCTSDAQCSDGLFCNGAETCNLGTGVCESGTAPNCNDGVSCTNDSCNESTDSCDNAPDDSACDNGLFCDGVETCNASTGCQDNADPCSGGQTCNESTDTCEGGGSCPTCIDWTTTPTVSYSNQDASANVTVEDADTIFLQDNTWRRTTQTFAVTANTVIEFDFQSTSQGEIHGIGFDADDTLSSDRIFKVHGTQNWGITDFDNYSGSGFVHYTIPVGQYFTGSAMFLVLVNDNDAGSGNNSRFQNVEVYENAPGPCTVDDDFESGTAGWVNEAASTCSTGDYVAGNPTAQSSGGVTTQVGGSASGTTSIFTATNTAAGTNDVDGGNCILGSPSWSVTNASTLSVNYFHGQRDAGDDASGDFFLLEYSLNGGSSWNTQASNGDTVSNAAWTNATAAIPAGSNVQLRVQCSDGAGPGDIIECGIDDVSICE